MLVAAGVSITVDGASLDEGAIKDSFRAEGHDAAACAIALAEAKAVRVAARHPDALVIGADQILDCAGTWFDKPRDAQEARAQLALLRGRQHTLVSAAAIVAEGAVIWHRTERAALTMRRFSDGFLDHYLAAMGASVTELVGGYALEGLGIQLFAKIDGDYFAILGLPLLPLLDFLRARGAIRQ